MRTMKQAILQASAADKFVSLLKHPRLLSSNFDYRNTLWLGGAGRSGTTWFANVVNYDRHYRDILEPFDSTYVAAARPFFSGLYLRPGDDTPRYLEAAKAIVSGKVGNRRLDYGNLRWFRRDRMVKEIHGNLWMKWLRDHFPEMPMIWLIRHPCAVVNSRWDLEWSTLVPQYLAQPTLMEDHLEPLRSHLEKAQSQFEKHVFGWCIQHYVPLRQLAQGDVHVVFYEQLAVDAPTELSRLSAFLDRPFRKGALSALGAPSRTNFRETEIAGKKGEEVVAGWQRRFSSEQVREAVRILELFGLDGIYSDSPLPKVKPGCVLQHPNDAEKMQPAGPPVRIRVPSG